MRVRAATALRGALRPPDNDSAFLLDPERRGVPGRETMARFDQRQEVDLLIVGCGAGGATLAQRLARRGWRIVVLEAGPFWDPDEDWVSDEAGSHGLFWNEPRVIGVHCFGDGRYAIEFAGPSLDLMLYHDRGMTIAEWITVDGELVTLVPVGDC